MDLMSLLIRIGADTTQAEKGIATVQSGMQETAAKSESFGSKVGSAFATGGKVIAGVATTAVAAGGAMVAFASKSAQATDAVDKNSQMMGVSRQTYQELEYVLSQNGSSIDSFQMGMKSLTAAMDGAKSGTANNVEQFQRLGVAVTNSDGSFRSQEDVMWDTIKALQGMDDQTEKSRLATELFGRAGMSLMPMLNSEAGSVENLRQRAHDLGLVMSDELVDSGVKLTDSLDSTKRAFSAIIIQLGGSLFPVITQVSDAVQEAIPSISAMFQRLAPIISQVLSGLIPPLMQLGKTIVPLILDLIQQLLPPITRIVQAVLPGLGSVLGAILPPITRLASAVLPVLVDMFERFLPLITAVVSAFVAYKAAMGIITLIQTFSKVTEAATIAQKLLNLAMSANPIGLVVAAISGLIAVIVTLWNTNEGFRNAVIAAWNAIKAAATAVFSAVRDTIVGAWEAIKKAWSAVVGFFKGIWDGITKVFSSADKWFSDKFSAAVDAIKKAWDSVVNFFKSIWDGITNVFKQTGQWFSDKFTSARDAIKNAFSSIGDFFKGIWNNITNVFGDAVSWFSAKFTAAKEAVIRPFRNVADWFSNLWSSIKGAIKLPHFSIAGSFSLVPPSVPRLKVDWYKSAYDQPMLFTSPTVLPTSNGLKGFGDGNGAELVIGMNKLQEMLGRAASTVNINVYATPYQSAEDIASEVQKVFVRWENQKKVAYA